METRGLSYLYDIKLQELVLMSESKRIRIYPVGMSLGTLLSLGFVICVLFGLLFAWATMYQLWLPLLPGVTWITWPGVLVGLAESFAYGWFVALILVPAWNYFSKAASA